jgi:hypothetical protein
MTETELTDQLREAIVLNGPDIWRTNGYLQEAQQAGLSTTDALKRATEVGQEVEKNKLLFENIQARITRLAQPSRSHLIEQDLNQIVNAATALKLSANFVRNKWVPNVLKQLVVTPNPQPVSPATAPPQPVVAQPTPTPDSFRELLNDEPKHPEPTVVIEHPVIELPKPTPTPPPTVTEAPVSSPTPSYPEPPPIVRTFTATPARIRKGQAVTLDWEVENLLAVTIDDLGEGLSPKNRGWVKPSKTTDYTLFDANNNPLSTVRIEVIPPDRSGIYGVLFALAILAVIYWFIKSNTSRDSESRPKRKTEQSTSYSGEMGRSEESSDAGSPGPAKNEAPSQATDAPAAATDEPAVSSTDGLKKEEKTVINTDEESAPAQAEPDPKPTTPADARQGKYEEAFGDKPYDKVELGTDERGWRRARSNGHWGYINEADEWVIKPEYEAVTPFRGNTAAVFLNGQLMTINRAGEQVRN